ELALRLNEAGLSMDRVKHEATEMVLFGSRAAGCARADSDWDLLLVAPKRLELRRCRQLDIIWIPTELRRSDAWNARELASHVAAFGEWLHGDASWTANVRPELAAPAKAAILRKSVENVKAWWNVLTPLRLERHLRMLRLDAQRWILLRAGNSMVPTCW